MTGNTEEFLRQLEAQRAQYRRELPGKVARIAAQWRELATGPADAARREELERLIHGLSGSGAVFGLPGIGEAAKAMELQVQRLRASGEVATDEARAAIDAALAGLEQALRQVAT